MVLDNFNSNEGCLSEPTLDDPKFRITPTQQMAAACTGALITSLFVTPLDVVKIRLQAQQKTLMTKKCLLHSKKRPGHFAGTFDAFAKISRTEGLQSLWSGLTPTLVLALPATVVYFVGYEQLRTRLVDWARPNGSQQPLWAPLIAGCTARLWAATIVSPLELVRTKMQSKRLSYLEVHEVIKGLLKHHGWKGLWKGLGPTLLRDVPFSGVYWVTYEKIKMLNRKKKSSFAFCFIGGSIAGTLAAFVTTPFDVVKTYRQIEMTETEIIREPPRKSTHSVMTGIYRRNGSSGLFTGLLPRIIKVAPACAIMVATFEYGKQFFQNYNLNEYKVKQNGIQNHNS